MEKLLLRMGFIYNRAIEYLDWYKLELGLEYNKS
jgi:hypothetical protein